MSRILLPIVVCGLIITALYWMLGRELDSERSRRIELEGQIAVYQLEWITVDSCLNFWQAQMMTIDACLDSCGFRTNWLCVIDEVFPICDSSANGLEARYKVRCQYMTSGFPDRLLAVPPKEGWYNYTDDGIRRLAEGWYKGTDGVDSSEVTE